jgi:hypothetical protein
MEYFDLGAIEALVKQCEIISEEDVQLTKIALFQNRLQSEFANFTNVALGQRQLIIKEIPNTLSFVLCSATKQDLIGALGPSSLLQASFFPDMAHSGISSYTFPCSSTFQHPPTPCLLLLEPALEVSRFTLKLLKCVYFLLTNFFNLF